MATVIPAKEHKKRFEMQSLDEVVFIPEEEDEEEEETGEETEEESDSQTGNAFCPTGKGGGIDATCGPGGKQSFEETKRITGAAGAPDPPEEVEALRPSELKLSRKPFVKEVVEDVRDGRGVDLEAVDESFVVGGTRIRNRVMRIAERRADEEGNLGSEAWEDVGNTWTEHLLPSKSIANLVRKEAGIATNVDVDNAFCPTGKGGGIDATCSPKGTKGGAKAGKTTAQKLKDVGKKVLAAVNAMPTFAKEVAKQAGASPTVANFAYAAATIGDFAVPGIPVGSATVIALSSIKKPRASYDAAVNVIRGLRGQTTNIFADDLTLNQNDVKKRMERLLELAQEWNDPEQWFVFYLAAHDEGVDDTEAASLAAQAMKELKR